MKSPRQMRSPTLGEEIDLLYLRLMKAHAPYEAYKREFLKLQKQWLRRAKTMTQRLAVQRIIASTLLTEAYGARLPWKEFGRWLRCLQRLGFAGLGMRVHVSCLYAQSLYRFPRRAREAWDMLDDAERRALKLRRGHPLREEYMQSIAHAKKVAQV